MDNGIITTLKCYTMTILKRTEQCFSQRDNISPKDKIFIGTLPKRQQRKGRIDSEMYRAERREERKLESGMISAIVFIHMVG